MSAEDLEKAFQAAQSFALIPVLLMLHESIGFENNTGVCTLSEPGYINLHSGDLSVNAKLSIVPSEFSIMDSFNESFGKSWETFEIKEDDSEEDKSMKELAINVITHLLKSAYVVFGRMREEPSLAEHQLNMDEETRLHLTGYESFISVVFQVNTSIQS